jgi:hypothetical protein
MARDVAQNEALPSKIAVTARADAEIRLTDNLCAVGV